MFDLLSEKTQVYLKKTKSRTNQCAGIFSKQQLLLCYEKHNFSGTEMVCFAFRSCFTKSAKCCMLDMRILLERILMFSHC